ncbi:hypothetical protein CDAR_382091 [Caerostris darwini]|uniref:Uncharacterized protein n=1 Tax=Caerostris darwini TaxID=1538125 RepID=A0AAV4WQR0_9ARAC|nr:hypothetical protein CDAR_382091 [Caerostris darwini]
MFTISSRVHMSNPVQLLLKILQTTLLEPEGIRLKKLLPFICKLLPENLLDMNERLRSSPTPQKQLSSQIPPPIPNSPFTSNIPQPLETSTLTSKVHGRSLYERV